MKKYFVLLVLAVAVCFTACGSTAPVESSKAETTLSPETTLTPPTETPESSTPAETPVESTSTETIPDESTSVESTPTETIPDESTPAESTGETSGVEAIEYKPLKLGSDGEYSAYVASGTPYPNQVFSYRGDEFSCEWEETRETEVPVLRVGSKTFYNAVLVKEEGYFYGDIRYSYDVDGKRVRLYRNSGSFEIFGQFGQRDYADLAEIPEEVDTEEEYISLVKESISLYLENVNFDEYILSIETDYSKISIDGVYGGLTKNGFYIPQSNPEEGYRERVNIYFFNFKKYANGVYTGEKISVMAVPGEGLITKISYYEYDADFESCEVNVEKAEKAIDDYIKKRFWYEDYELISYEIGDYQFVLYQDEIRLKIKVDLMVAYDNEEGKHYEDDRYAYFVLY